MAGFLVVKTAFDPFVVCSHHLVFKMCLFCQSRLSIPHVFINGPYCECQNVIAICLCQVVLLCAPLILTMKYTEKKNIIHFLVEAFVPTTELIFPV